MPPPSDAARRLDAGPPTPSPPPTYTTTQVRLVIGGLMLAMLLASLDQTIVSTALTTISRDFGRLDLYSWVVTAYLLTSTVSTPLYGRISDLYGRKRIFQVAIALFLIGSALCGAAQGMIELIIFRGVQGLGAGGVMSLAMAIVGDVVAPRERGRYQGYFGAVFGASSVLGPLIGGFLVDYASWRWVFYVNLPVGVLALLVIQRVLRADQSQRRAKVDVAGSLLLVGGVALLLVAVQDLGGANGMSTPGLLLAVGGAVGVAVFLWWETRVAEPILPLRLFRVRVFAVSNALALITGVVMFGAVIFLPQYLQIVKHQSPTSSGLHTLPLLVGVLTTSIITGRLVTRLGRYRVFAVAGTAVVIVGLVLLSQVRVGTGTWAFSIALFVLGVGLGSYTQILVVAAQNSVAQGDLGVATSTVSFSRTLGGALGASVLGAVLIAREKQVLPSAVAEHGSTEGPLHAFTAGMDRAYLWAVPVGVVAFALACFLRDLPMRSTNDLPTPPDTDATAEAADSRRTAAPAAVASPAAAARRSAPAAHPAVSPGAQP